MKLDRKLSGMLHVLLPFVLQAMSCGRKIDSPLSLPHGITLIFLKR